MKQLIITHIDISPGQNKKCCENCKSFTKFGVHFGYCSIKEKDMMDSQKCKNYEKTIRNNKKMAS